RDIHQRVRLGKAPGEPGSGLTDLSLLVFGPGDAPERHRVIPRVADPFELLEPLPEDGLRGDRIAILEQDRATPPLKAREAANIAYLLVLGKRRVDHGVGTLEVAAD